MFKNSFAMKAGNWKATWKNAALELHCLSEDITKSDLCRFARVSVPTMDAYLYEGKKNKAYKELCKRLPKEMMMNC